MVNTKYKSFNKGPTICSTELCTKLLQTTEIEFLYYFGTKVGKFIKVKLINIARLHNNLFSLSTVSLCTKILNRIINENENC